MSVGIDTNDRFILDRRCTNRRVFTGNLEQYPLCIIIIILLLLFAAPDFNQEGWINAKPTLGLDFPNVSYLLIVAKR